MVGDAAARGKEETAPASCHWKGNRGNVSCREYFIAHGEYFIAHEVLTLTTDELQASQASGHVPPVSEGRH